MPARRTLYEGQVISNLVMSDSTKGCSFENLAYRVLQLQQVTCLPDHAIECIVFLSPSVVEDTLNVHTLGLNT